MKQFLLACAVAMFPFVCLAELPDHTSYPVFGILQVDPALRREAIQLEGADTFAPLKHYQLIYTTDTPALRQVRDAKKQYGYPAPVICYMGGFTTNGNGAADVEKNHRDAIAMIDVSALAEPIDDHADRITVRLPKDGEFPIKASTADVTIPSKIGTFCFWIRIDNELMKVLEADATTGHLRVQRGFESKPAIHNAGAVVLTPVYLGNRDHPDAARSSNSWPGGRDELRYALDPAIPAAQRYKADRIAELMKSGYDGAWLDTFQPHMFNLCDALGRKITYFWNFDAARRYDWDTGIASLQKMIRGTRELVKDQTGRNPYVAANSVTGSYTEGGWKLMTASDCPNLLDAYCFEDSYLGAAARRTGRRGTAQVEFDIARRWQTNIENQRDCAQRKLHGLCMVGPAGYVAAYLNPSLPNYDRFMRFSWCSFLLTVTKDRSTSFGLPLLVTKLDNGKLGFLPLLPMMFAPIGDPADDQPVANLKSSGGQTYLRKFTNGLVAVNPSNREETVTIPEGYITFADEKPATTLKLQAGDAAILLKK